MKTEKKKAILLARIGLFISSVCVCIWASAGIHSVITHKHAQKTYTPPRDSVTENKKTKKKKKRDERTGLSCEGTVIPLFPIIPSHRTLHQL